MHKNIYAAHAKNGAPQSAVFMPLPLDAAQISQRTARPS